MNKAVSRNGTLATPAPSHELASVEIEFDRDDDVVVISVRCPDGNFVLKLPLDGASTFAAAANRAVDYQIRSARSRFIVAKACLEVSK
jgi:hypothetical protein